MKSGGGHLRGQKAGPDQTVKTELIGGEKFFDIRRREGDVDGTYGFMRVLSACLALEHPALAARGEKIAAVAFLNVGRCRCAGFIRNTHGVRTHVGDQSRSAAIAQLYAFIQALRRGHGALGGKADSLVGCLLERRGGERRKRIAGAFLFFHRFHHKGLVLHGLFQLFRRLRIGNGGFLALDFQQFRLERRGSRTFQQGAEQPVFLRFEGLAFLLAFHDQAQCDGLNAPGRKCRA